MKRKSKLAIVVVSGLVIASPALAQTIPIGVEISGYGYNYFYYDIPVGDQQVLDPADTQVTLTFTVNTPSPEDWIWVGLPFILDDTVGGPGPGGDVWYGGYGGFQWNGNVATETAPLVGTTLEAVQTGGRIISYTLTIDPAVIPGGFYDLTYDSITLEPAPEPASLALVGLGALGLLAMRRRK